LRNESDRSVSYFSGASRGFRGTTSASVLALIATAALVAGPASAQTAQYSYDDMGRLTQVRYASGQTTIYSYDAAGNRTQVSSIQTSNQLPIAADDTATIFANQSVDIAVRDNDTDPDGDTLSVTSVSAVTGGGLFSCGWCIIYVLEDDT